MTAVVENGSRGTCEQALFDRVSTRLGVARQMRGLTIKDVAARAECHASTLSRVENGMALPTIPALVRLATALDVSMAWVLDGDEGLLPTIYCIGIDVAPSIVKRRTKRHARKPSVSRRLAIAIRALAVKGGAELVPFTHIDGEATFAVTRGVLQIRRSSKSLSAFAGDSFHLCSSELYDFTNGSEKDLAITIFSRSTPSTAS